jgi:cytidylate kinase
MDFVLFAGTAVLGRYFVTPRKSLQTSTSVAAISWETLQQQNAVTSNALLEEYKDSRRFAKLAAYEGDLTIQRDQEDASKLIKGIEFAQQKGVIDPNFVPEPYIPMDVLGKTPDQVADLILQHVNEHQTTEQNGLVLVLVGLSGTGKGTTVAKLNEKLQQQGLSVTNWSNGNVFRSVTLLATTWCEQHHADDLEAALTKDNLASWMSMLSFGKNPEGVYDIRIQGLGLDCYVSKIQNTLLKSPTVSKYIPTVAQYTQGEVIVFAAQAVEILQHAGICVLLEGRELTVNYVRTPHRFVLHLSDESLIGKRRAAQRLMAAALHDAEQQRADNSSVKEILEAALDRLVEDITQN